MLLELPPIPGSPQGGLHGRKPCEAPAIGDCQEKTAGRCVFREASSSSFRRSRAPLKEDCMAGSHAKHQQSEIAKKKQQDAVFFVKHPPRASADPGLDKSESSHRSPRRKPGDSGYDHHPACHADPGTPNGPVSPDFRPGLVVKHASDPEGRDARDGLRGTMASRRVLTAFRPDRRR